MITLLTTAMCGAREPLELPLLGPVSEVKGFLTSGDVAAKWAPASRRGVSALPLIADGYIVEGKGKE